MASTTTSPWLFGGMVQWLNVEVALGLLALRLAVIRSDSFAPTPVVEPLVFDKAVPGPVVQFWEL